MNRFHPFLITSISVFTAFVAIRYWMIRFSTDQFVFVEALLYTLVIMLPNFVCLFALYFIISRDTRKVYFLIAIYCIVIFNTFAYIDTALAGRYNFHRDMALEHVMYPIAVYQMSFFFLPVAWGMTLAFPGSKRVDEVGDISGEDSP